MLRPPIDRRGDVVTMARAKLRSPTSVASVATKGGRPTTVISQACRLPIESRRTGCPRWPGDDRQVDRRVAALHLLGARIKASVAQMVPLKQITEPDDRSMPPAMITIAEPSAKMPSSDVCRAICTQLVHGIVDIAVLGIEQRGQGNDEHDGEDQARFVSAQKAERDTTAAVRSTIVVRTLRDCNGRATA